jgi:hypothetical protein
MCGGPVGDGQSYWGVIQIKIANGQMTAAQLEAFKTKLTDFLNGNQTQAGLPQNASASLANGVIKTDDPDDGATVKLVNRNA